MANYAFASDNTAGACPEAMAALVAANTGFSSGYGGDDVTARAADAVRALLDCDADVRFVASGTAANAVACAALCRPFESVAAHRHAHICREETGAPAFFGHGLGLTRLPGASGKIDPAGLAAALDRPEDAGRQSPAALSITNITEDGTLYTQAQVAELTGLARARGLSVHLDGARLANAAAAGFDVKALKTLDIDILVLGGAKAGAPLSEALVLFDKTLSRRFDARLKQSGQLPSKSRFISAPWLGLLRDDAWTRHAAHANAMARKLAAGLPHPILHPVDGNMIFAEMDAAAQARLRAKGWAFYGHHDGTSRFLCSWATTEAMVEELLAAMRAG
jgi:threonine aldolase